MNNFFSPDFIKSFADFWKIFPSTELRGALFVFLLVMGGLLLKFARYSNRHRPHVFRWNFVVALFFGASAYLAMPLATGTYIQQTGQQQNKQANLPGSQPSNNMLPVDSSLSPNVLLALVAMTLTFMSGFALKTSRDALTDIRDLKEDINDQVDQEKRFRAQIRLHMRIVTRLQELHFLISSGDGDYSLRPEMVALEYWREFVATSDSLVLSNVMEKLAISAHCHEFCPTGTREYLELLAT
uniref:hypothetical protein n=1 Tax=Candidatus Magnetaquicoccus inordinatus TaxID=2496818 RepID=UPI00102D2743